MYKLSLFEIKWLILVKSNQLVKKIENKEMLAS